MRTFGRTTFWGLGCFLSVCLFACPVGAVYLNQGQTLELTGELQTRSSLRTEDSQGLTTPPVDAGEMVQHRSMAYLEVHHDLEKVDWPGDFKVKYHMRGRFMYEGVFDYGPSQFQDLPDRNHIEDVDDFKWSAELWEAYADISRGALFFRLGRQNLSWGETDVFRLLDSINPLDNTFGGIFEDLDDRRIPLLMARGSYNLGDLGPVSSFTLEGFWVPGSIENEVSPLSPPGTPYALPIPAISHGSIPGVVSLFDRHREPDDDMDNSRWGIRVQGILGDNLTLALAHYKAYLDDPVARFVLDRQFDPMSALPASVALESSFEDVRITGASMNFYEINTNMVIRSEVAWLEDVPVFIPEVNMPGPAMVPTGMTEPFPSVVPQFKSGEIPVKNQLRFALALDKDIWVRSLNPVCAFSVTLQYTLQHTDAHDERMRVAVPDPATHAATIKAKEIEQTYTMVITNQSGWQNGNILPQLIFSYEPRGAWFIQPQVEYKFEPFRLKLQYSTIRGNFVGLGMFRDRDQATLELSWLF